MQPWPARGRRASPSNSATWLRRISVPSVASIASSAMFGISRTSTGARLVVASRCAASTCASRKPLFGGWSVVPRAAGRCSRASRCRTPGSCRRRTATVPGAVHLLRVVEVRRRAARAGRQRRSLPAPAPVTERRRRPASPVAEPASHAPRCRPRSPACRPARPPRELLRQPAALVVADGGRPEVSSTTTRTFAAVAGRSRTRSRRGRPRAVVDGRDRRRPAGAWPSGALAPANALRNAPSEPRRRGRWSRGAA